MGRIKEISRKSAHTRKRNPVVYLICEGSETEIRYFKRFRSRGCNIDIIPISSQYKSADRLVQKAKATMGNNPCLPASRAGLKGILREMDVPFYDSLLIIEKTKGRMTGDHQWIQIIKKKACPMHRLN